MSRWRSILVAVDFAESSREALALAHDLAELTGASLTLVHVYEVPGYLYSEMIAGAVEIEASIEAAARQQLERTLAEARQRAPDARAVLRQGVPWREILAAAEAAHADLIVVGTHGRRGLGHALLGSVAEKVVRLSPVPVLTVHRGAARPAPQTPDATPDGC